ncbi:hypothetical protein [Frigoriglobus tundricola]|uniref:Uncharacterized protein n=1 Tax=Frigoriglobus tundricola TaxID=2774151 RepID=A0A6M5YZY6_9BACT|nr:hypothetical protein [Frigoriglobus tundricola]QJW99629.1 hypothetical protein FTUN_7247 [Frigoriglobus tundricola]
MYPALVARCARTRGPTVTPFVPDYRRSPGDAEERGDVDLTTEADAALVARDGREPGARRLLERVERRGAPVLLWGGRRG